MLKYTRWIASRPPIESSPPFRMWWTVSVFVLLCQHLPSRPGSHQQVASGSLFSHEPTLRHLLITSPSKTGRRARLMIAFIVPGLFTWSVGTADVSEDPGTRVREHLILETLVRHAGSEHLGDARILVADRALDVVPLRMRRIFRRIERIERDVARPAGHADQEGWFDRSVGETADARVIRTPDRSKAACEARPSSRGCRSPSASAPCRSADSETCESRAHRSRCRMRDRTTDCR